MADAMARVRWDLRAFLLLVGMWVRVSWSYRASFVLMTVSSFFITGIDFIGILVLFSNVDHIGGFGLPELAFLYGCTSFALGSADLVIGNVERLGQRIRMGTFDAMMVRPVGVLAQMCADEFALRRLGRILQAVVILAWAITHVDVHWDLGRVLVVPAMLLCGTLIFGGIFVLGASFQFVSTDGSEVANAFTYGGDAMTQYPLTIYPTEVVKALTFIVPVAFVNWYPALYVLDLPDPVGLPDGLRFASPVAAAVIVVLASLAWRSGVRRYRSTGS